MGIYVCYVCERRGASMFNKIPLCERHAPKPKPAPKPRLSAGFYDPSVDAASYLQMTCLELHPSSHRRCRFPGGHKLPHGDAQGHW